MASKHQANEETRAGQSSGRENRQQKGQQGGSFLSPFAHSSPFTFGGPFGLIRRMHDDIDRLFSSSLRRHGGAEWPEQGIAPWSPPIEAFQRGNEFVIRAELPGMSPDNVDVEVAEDAVVIRGERREEREDEREGAVVSEIRYGMFDRVIPLPPGAIADDAAATFRNGVLEVIVPAPSQEVRRGRRLEIQRGNQERQNQERQNQERQNQERQNRNK